jgi:hypothetical protein
MTRAPSQITDEALSVRRQVVDGLPLTWVAVPDDLATRHVIWHAAHVVQLDGMSNVVSPVAISTRCRGVFPREKILRTARVKPELLNAHFCPCCEHDLRIPEGWLFEPFPRDADHALLSTPSPRRYMATIDFRARGFRGGYSTTGRRVGEEWNKSRKKYGGRGWRQTLLDDAVGQLQELL